MPASNPSPLPLRGEVKEAEGGFGVYVHWPFCLSKCPYCDFNSHVVANVDQRQWAAALARELRYMRELTGPRAVSSVFFGGGTPSLMEVATVDAVLTEIAKLWNVDADVEISLEANPTSVEAERFRGYRSAGVNRLSLGVQSLDDAQLKFLGRLHSADEALAAIGLAREIFPRLSFDLIYARPGQTAAAWARELRMALSHAADHLSLYQLTIEEGTAFARLYEKGAFRLPEEDDAAELYRLTGEIAGEAGLSAYEVSNYAKPGAECRHNLVYWRYGDYAGVGPGAHGRVTTDEGRLATAALKAPGAWLASVEASGHGLEVADPVKASEQGDEMMLMGLRLEEGVSLKRYERLTGRALDTTRVDGLIRDGALSRDGDIIKATPEGRLVLNGVLGRLLA
ncbi:MAG: radical SAM family heme chaperone HemW [Parvibaculum sp.]|uniref:radical SAM family heme chaperone HemW n=1 Tax=Parvibaculum sp. TaxID=2024848 RepID=UPI0025DC1687|nr:radical SAM family heme chaperone HemW [Parvibaculum sp.]MCE9648125.1 radical SAM family heme chaperone HemW [Parvibaculum sp.]